MRKIFDFIVIAIIIVFALFLPFKSGERGFFPLDQSIVFDGAYRIIQGQIPYKDFLMPFGPMAFWIQAIFFKLLGIHYFSYLFGAAFINALAVICSILILRQLFPGYKFLTYIAGILTAIWFYPPFGTPWFEQTAFFFSFVSLVLILYATKNTKPSAIAILCGFSGIFSSLAILSKQNAGLFILPLYIIILLLFPLRHLSKNSRLLTIFSFLGGFLGTLTSFFFWLFCWSDSNMFLQYYIQIPARLGFNRIFGNLSALFVNIVTGMGPKSNRLVIFVFLIIALYLFARALYKFKAKENNNKNLISGSLLYIYLTFYQYLFCHTTCNQDVNGFPFIGVMLAIGIGLAIYLFKSEYLTVPHQQKIKVVFFTAALVALCYVGVRGLTVSLRREVQDIFSYSVCPEYFKEETLRNLRWAYPTIIEKTDITKQQIVELIAYLKSEKKKFFTFPDFTILYGLTGMPSPQPLLWFQKEWTYLGPDNSKLDKWVVADLIKKNVEIIVIEEESFLGTVNRLNDFPLLKSYIEQNFQPVKKIGIFKIYSLVQQ